ncbi:MAG: diguanylate cyclase [Desulfuromonadaceae bacterium]|nr:diguanylate cyclase [Desulfuromonadaceae bacterium]
MKRYVVTCVVFLVFLAGSWLLIYSRCQHIRDDHLQLHLTTERAAINSSIGTYRLLAQAINDEVIQTEPVLRLVEGITRSEGAEQNILRGKLYRLLDPVYQRLRGKQVRQLHFHFPDSRSMLRFHAPSRSGDSLATVRPSVVMANTRHVAVHGFETGRVFHGFRHVFPLFYQQQPIGSVEISTSFYQIREEFKQLTETEQTQLTFLLYRPEMWDKLFPDLKLFYQPSLLSRDYVIERADLISSICSENMSTSSLIEKVQRRLKASSEIGAQLAAQQSFAVATNLDGQTYTVVFHSIVNSLDQHAAYIMSVTPEPFLASIREDGVWMGCLSAFLLTMVLLYRLRFLAADEKEKRQSLFLSSISDNLGTALYTTNERGELTFVNGAMERLLGYAQQEILGRNAHELFHHSPHQAEQDCFCEQAIQQNRTIVSDDYIFKDRMETVFPVEIICSPLRENRKIIGTTTIFQDISRRREQERQLKETKEKLKEANTTLLRLATHDGLTEVANRRSFNQQIERVWRAALRQQTPLGLLMIDIDHFKCYNDYFGHQQGDVCLQAVAETLQRACQRPGDFVARYGGEEFAVLLPDTDANDSFHVAKRIQHQLAAQDLQNPAATEFVRVTLSIGCCSLIPAPDQTVEDLIRLADQSLYRAKKEGRNRICCCSSEQ